MDCRDDILSFMDLLDLDEEMVDERLKTIMQRSNYTYKHLTSAVHLLQYKHLINLRESSECDNDDECNFLAKLFEDLREENIEIVCKIVHIVLSLNSSSIVSKSEHLLQQILSDLHLPSKEPKKTSDYDIDEKLKLKMLLNFKLCNSILNAVLINKEKLSLHFLEIPVENVLNSGDEKLKIYFLTNIVPKLFEAVIGYNILDRIWEFLKLIRHVNEEHALKTLCCLSEFFLPVADMKGKKTIESEIIFHHEFWSILLCGLKSNDPSVRKLSIYLMKRAIDCLFNLKKDAKIHTEFVTLFTWNCKNQNALKQMWDNYFILVDSLEEKQSNIVLPSLKLFDCLNDPSISNWLYCAFNIGLQHDNTQVRLKCIEYKLKSKIYNVVEAKSVLEAMNDINLFDKEKDCEVLKNRLAKSFASDDNNFKNILTAISEVKWSPVPFYHISCVLSEFNWEKQLKKLEALEITKILVAILEVPCNNIPIRNAVKVNILHMIQNYNKLNWKDLHSIYCSIKWDSLNNKTNNPLTIIINKLTIREDEIKEFFNVMCESYINIELVLVYLENHKDDIGFVLNILNEKIKNVQEIISRQYSKKTECFNDVVFITYAFMKCVDNNGDCKKTIKAIISKEIKTVLQYILTLLPSDSKLTIEEIALLFEGVRSLVASADSNVKEILLQLYKYAILLLKEFSTDLDKKVLAIFIVNTLTENLLMVNSYEHEMLSFIQLLEMVKGMKFKECCDIEYNGRYRNIIYEKTCTVMYSLLKDQDVQLNLNKIEGFIENMTECGGYGCLKWILKIMNKVIPIFVNEQYMKFNVGQFFGKMWQEIEELKSNNQYSPCIEEFTNLLLQDSLLKKPVYNNIVIQYCNKIIDYAPLKNTPLFYLVRNLHEMNITQDLGQIVYVLCEIMLYSPVPKKDHRIAENVAVEIILNPKYGLNKNNNFHFNFQIQYLALSTLCKIKHKEIFQIIFTLIEKRIEEVLDNKQRYHGNSQMHRTLLIALQHRLMFFLLHLDMLKSENIVLWCVELLGRLPHQPSVRICLEWFIALHIYFRKATINEVLVEKLGIKNVPITSQFIILYWTLKHKIDKGDYKTEEFEFVMHTLLSHTMGQIFNVRLHAQYLATKLYEINKINKYNYIIEVIEKTFIDSSKDKNFVKLKEDFFINEFDIVKHLTPSFIFYFLPRYCDIVSNEKVDQNFIEAVTGMTLDAITKGMIDNDFNKEWKCTHKSNDEVFGYNFNKTSDANTAEENSETLGTIQKKYIPWKSMSDIDVYDCGKKKESPSELIVVASLIDKLPNLGGMARTSEVFGVNTYVVNSLRHLQDKQFQGLSVSAERWVNIEEVRPGAPLKRYLTQKSSEGYSIVAAEQTSTSCQLQSFKFPKKTLLLLGHEKEGIPCELLHLMDHCVEIPQQGFVRSLNVHVTAAIFIWEYSRQNILHL